MSEQTIETLTAERDRLREALEKVKTVLEFYQQVSEQDGVDMPFVKGAIKVVRTALSEGRAPATDTNTRES